MFVLDGYHLVSGCADTLEVGVAEVPEPERGAGSVVDLPDGVLAGHVDPEVKKSTTVFTGVVETGMFCARILLSRGTAK